MQILDSQVHIWGADTPERPWPKGGSPRPHRAQPWTAQELVGIAERHPQLRMALESIMGGGLARWLEWELR